MRTYHQLVALALFVIISMPSMAYKYVGNGPGMTTNNAGMSSGETRAAACAPATGLVDQQWNNVKARIETGGNMWQDRQNSRAAYEVPKGGGVSAIYAGGLWMGGKSLDQTLKLAAVKFRGEGNDYWPGPLSNDGTAEVTPETCLQWDKFMVTYRLDAQKHKTYWDLINSGASAAAIEDAFPGGYAMPAYFNSYGAHGNTAAGQDYYLAPFKDDNGNSVYDPENGDYPWYDFLREIDCAARRREDQVPLFGDENYFWIFNDKGNIHTESGGQAIGIEVRAQAFAFTTNDEVNNMTFLNYVLINQGSQTLTETFFGSWVDPDLGFAYDDYVGCDVQRGLGYCYNGDAFDEAGSSSLGYGQNPPAVGVDFFEGPYQDADGSANPLTSDIILAEDSLGIPYKGLGIGYGDSIIDNERFGMRRFVYYNNTTNAINGEPTAPQHFYNYLRGIWKNGADMLFGGNGVSGNGVVAGLKAQYMFPGDTDPYNWSTYGLAPPTASIPWTEQSAGNSPADRRFIQSAGPFILEPGDYNNITLGVVWARAVGGDPFESVQLLRLADDKAQSLFDNCFELVNGPDAPDVTVQELDREIILMLTNENPLSNNYHENYLEFDPSIPDSLQDGTQFDQIQRSYVFEGYLVYQLKDAEVSNADLGDIDKARLIAQCDMQNDILEIINYNRDLTTGLITPSLMVQGANIGVRHSFRVLEDAFALGNKNLINHRTYYFMVVAYGYNEYQPYDLTTSTGQDDVFKASRKSAVGEVPRIVAIPHNVSPEEGGTVLNSSYGDGVFMTRLEGKGNGTNDLIISGSSENELLAPPYTTSQLQYMPGRGPVTIKVVDPLRIPAADFELALKDTLGVFNPDSMYWKLKNLTNNEVDSALNAFSTLSEDLILNYGISINWGQYTYFDEEGLKVVHFTGLVNSSIAFANPANPWLTGIPDSDGFTELNWIRSGTVESEVNVAPEEKIYDDYKQGSGDFLFTDAKEAYEKVLNGTWSPYCLVSYSAQLTPGDSSTWMNNSAPTSDELKGDLSPFIATPYISNILGLNNVDVVFTSDKSKWTRCPVLEMQSISSIANVQSGIPDAPTTAKKMKLRVHRSVDKNGRTSLDPGYHAGEGDLTSAWGLGWFPGYVIDLGTGERLNVAFGEDSWLNGENGNDMIWNPTGRLFGNSGQPLFGGQHWIYVFKNLRNEAAIIAGVVDQYYCPRYDEANFLFSKLSEPTLSPGNHKKIFRACTWVGSGLTNGQLLTPEQGLIPGDVRVSLRVAKPYSKYSHNDTAVSDTTNAQNAWRNLYTFTTKNLAPLTNNGEALTSALDMINIVPNPYYAFSSYETGKLDNRVKITNLPFVCTVNIYDLTGTLIRQYKKSDPTTSIDWDLKNHRNIPIASGTYIIHVNVPNIGEKVLKWFGIMRPIDLDSF